MVSTTGKTFIIMFILVTKISCGITQHSFFQLTREGQVIKTDKHPLLDEIVQSRVSCFMKCLNQVRCFYVQIKENAGKWSCRLFSRDVSVDVTEEDMGSDIFSVVGNPRQSEFDIKESYECIDLYQGGFKKDGVYNIKVNGHAIQVFCDMTNEGGGWTVIQRRIDGSVSFDRIWSDYKNGFGNIEGEYWLGNDFIHQMTNSRSFQNPYLIRIKATTFEGLTQYIIFKGFRIGGEDRLYKLQTGDPLVDDYNIGADWRYHDRMFFSTKDWDYDMGTDYSNCADSFSGGWWYKDCFQMNPNGIYSNVETISHSMGIEWFRFNGYGKSMKEISMAIKHE